MALPIGATADRQRATRGECATGATRKSQSESVKKFLPGDSRPIRLTKDGIEGRNNLAETVLNPHPRAVG
jgi:hypothetical protein